MKLELKYLERLAELLAEGRVQLSERLVEVPTV
jgi:hypothetical protein